MWEHTRRALYTQGREHPRTDTIYKLSCLMCDTVRRHGCEISGQILLTAGIGHEKVASILHVCELYDRFSRMFRQGNYVATPRVLPHFKNALSKNRDNFRRLVRALNTGLQPDEQLPWRIFYDDGMGPEPRETRRPRRRQRSKTTVPTVDTDIETAVPDAPATSERNHKRNVKRREQRKRARTRRQNTNESKTAETAINQQS